MHLIVLSDYTRIFPFRKDTGFVLTNKAIPPHRQGYVGLRLGRVGESEVGINLKRALKMGDGAVQSFFGLGEEHNHKEEWSFEADHPEVFAAEDQGITPIEYLLVGLASCLTGGIASVAENRGIQLRSVESTVEGGHDIRGILGADSDVRNGYNDIKVTFNIDADASRQEIEALVAQSQKRSAVYDIITNPTNVSVEVK